MLFTSQPTDIVKVFLVHLLNNGFSGSLPCMLFIDIISLFINWANKDACLLSCDLFEQEI